MSDQHPRGPVMIAATNMLRPPPARVGKITDEITLPRSVELKKVIAGGAGVLVGLILWVIPVGPLFGYSLESFLSMFLFGAGLGILVVTVSPLRGESLAKWIALTTSSSRGERVLLGGRKVQAYIGVAPLPYTAAGSVHVQAGAVDVIAGTVDDRGVPVSAADVRRQKLQLAGGHVAPPSLQDGFAPLQSIGNAPTPNSRAEALATAPPAWAAGSAGLRAGVDGQTHSPLPAGASQPVGGLAAQLDGFMEPPKRLPKSSKR